MTSSQTWAVRLNRNGLHDVWRKVVKDVAAMYDMPREEVQDAIPTMFLTFVSILESPLSAMPYHKILDEVTMAVEDWRTTQTDERPPFFEDGVSYREQLSQEHWNNLSESEVRMVI